MENKLLPVALILFPLALFIATNQPTIPDRAYGALQGDSLLKGIGIGELQYLSLAVWVASALLIYFSFSQTRVAWLGALLLILSPGSMVNASFLVSPRDLLALVFFAAAAFLYRTQTGVQKALAILPLGVGAYISYWNFDFWTNLAGVGFLAPLGILSLLNYEQEKKAEPLVFFLLGIGGAAVMFPFALVASTLAAIDGMRILAEKNPTVGWSMLVAAAGFYLLLLGGEQYAIYAGVALGLGALFHLMASLYHPQPAWAGIAGIALVVLSTGIGYTVWGQEARDMPSADMAAFFETLQSYPGAIGLLQFNNSFTYTTGRQAERIDVSDLLGEADLGVDYVVLSSPTLFNKLDSTLRPYAFVQKERTAEGGVRAVFRNSRYVLVVVLSPNEKEILQAVQMDSATQQPADVVFTKLRPLYPDKALTDPENLLVNTDGIEGSNLYRLLTGPHIVKEKDGIALVRWGSTPEGNEHGE